MTNNYLPYGWLYSQKAQASRLILIALLGLLSGMGFIRYAESLALVNMAHSDYVNLLWWMIPLSSLIWIFLRFILRPFPIIALSGLYYLGSVSGWLYYQIESPAIIDIVIKDKNFLAFFVFVGLLLATMSIVDYYLLAPNAAKLIALSLFYYLFLEILSALIPDYSSSRLQAFLVSLMIVLILSSGWIVLIEFLMLIGNELSGKSRNHE